jgi:nitrogen fixation/metabolism regulation signal transduction histidine kinase
MPEFEHLTVDRSKPGRWTITFSNPPINMLELPGIEALQRLMTEIESDQSVKSSSSQRPIPSTSCRIRMHPNRESLRTPNCRKTSRAIAYNLLLNAAEAMAGVMDRPRTLIVQTAIHNSSSVQLLVRDSGIGVDPLAIEKMFAAFYTTKAHGMGVGLAVSRSIIESHEGQLWAAPNDGPGASFGFYFPNAF